MKTCPVCGCRFERHRKRPKNFKRSLWPRGDCCSGRCYDKKRYVIISRSARCLNCGNPCGRGRRNKSGKCRKCCHAEVLALFQLDGENNPNWKGGHKNWVPGRFGRDKDGLSWKHQRKLAYVRDGGKCQDPECKTPWKRICVHHKVPYRISLSHALKNLICLCDGCHPRWDAKVHEKWGGQCVVRPPKPIKARCAVCRWPLKDGKCVKCELRHRNARMLVARNEGKSFPEIARLFGLKSHSSVIMAFQRNNLLAA